MTLELDKVQKRLVEHNVTIQVTEEARGWLCTKGYDPDYGARPLRRVIQAEVEDVLSDGLLGGRFSANGTIHIGLEDGKLVFESVIIGAPVPEVPQLSAPEAPAGLLFGAN